MTCLYPPSDFTLVCQHCGSTNIITAGKHGWVECGECGEIDHAVACGDWLSGQEGPHQIPEGYAEQ